MWRSMPAGPESAARRGPSQRADSAREQVEGQKVAGAVERLHLPAHQPEEPHITKDVEQARECMNVAVQKPARSDRAGRFLLRARPPANR